MADLLPSAAVSGAGSVSSPAQPGATYLISPIMTSPAETQLPDSEECLGNVMAESGTPGFSLTWVTLVVNLGCPHSLEHTVGVRA